MHISVSGEGMFTGPCACSSSVFASLLTRAARTASEVLALSCATLSSPDSASFCSAFAVMDLYDPSLLSAHCAAWAPAALAIVTVPSSSLTRIL